MSTRESSTKTQKRSSRARSSPPSGASPPSGDGSTKEAGTADSLHTPHSDGFQAGFELAQKYPDDMIRVLQGYKEGAKRGKKLADARRGCNNG